MTQFGLLDVSEIVVDPNIVQNMQVCHFKQMISSINKVFSSLLITYSPSSVCLSGKFEFFTLYPQNHHANFNQTAQSILGWMALEFLQIKGPFNS